MAGMPADWLSPDSRFSRGRWVASLRHQRVEATEQDLGLRVRCHDCGVTARAEYRRAVYDDRDCIIPERDPVPLAVARLDREACEPLGARPLFDLAGVGS